MSKKKEYLVSGYRPGESEAIIGIRARNLESAVECAQVALMKKQELGIIHVTIESFDASSLKVEWASYE